MKLRENLLKPFDKGSRRGFGARYYTSGDMVPDSKLPPNQVLNRAYRNGQYITWKNTAKGGYWKMVDPEDAEMYGTAPSASAAFESALDEASENASKGSMENSSMAEPSLFDMKPAMLRRKDYNKIGDYKPEDAIRFTNYADAAKFVADTPKPSWLEIEPLTWRMSLAAALSGSSNIVFTGWQGSGKTETAMALCSVLRRNLYIFNMGATQDPKLSLIGTIHYDAGEGTVYHPSRFANAIQDENSMILMDEVSRMDREAGNILMTVLDPKQRYLAVDESRGGKNVPVATGVTFIATANLGTEFSGTNALDRAFIDRATLIEIKPIMDEKKEVSVLKHNYPALPDAAAERIAKLAVYSRKEVLENPDTVLSNIISTRVSLKMAETMLFGFTFRETAQLTLGFYSNADVDDEFSYIMKAAQRDYDCKIDFNHPNEIVEITN